MKTYCLISLVIFLTSWRDAHAHALLTKPISKQGADENSYALAPGQNFALASWWLDRAHFDNDPQNTPFTRPGEFSYQDARTCCGVDQVFHPCGCRVGSDISTCAAVGEARGFGELVGRSPITPEKVSMGANLKTKFNMHANHAGGYAYSLCPKQQYDSCYETHQPQSGAVDAPSTLAYLECVWTCFEENPLSFAGEQKLQLRGNEADHVKMNAVTKSGQSGALTTTYREVPIADVGSNSNSWQYVKSFSNGGVREQFTADFGPEVPAGTIQVGLKGHNPTEWQVVDEVAIPAPASGLAAGEYLLSWRYDCGTANQIWSNCADVELVVGPVPTPDPSATTTPAAANPATTGGRVHGMCQNCAVGTSGPCKGGASGTGCWDYTDPDNNVCPPGTEACFTDAGPGPESPYPTQAPEGSCTDTADWHNNFAQPLSCADYVTYGFCIPENKRSGFGKQWTLGSHYNNPERNCCACGKGTVYETIVANFESDGLLERDNRDTQMGQDIGMDTANPEAGTGGSVVDGSAQGTISWSLVGALSSMLWIRRLW